VAYQTSRKQGFYNGKIFVANDRGRMLRVSEERDSIWVNVVRGAGGVWRSRFVGYIGKLLDQKISSVH
jgi:hypothetical protein